MSEHAPEEGKRPKIQNKMKRSAVFQTAKREKAKAKLQKRLAQRKAEALDPALREERLKKNIPRTVENSKTWVGLDRDGNVVDRRTVPVQLLPTGGEDMQLDMAGLESLFPDEQAMHFAPTASTSKQAIQNVQSPILRESNDKILITTSPKPSKDIFPFLKEVQSLFGGNQYVDIIPRKNARFQLSKVCKWANQRGYNALVIIGEDHKHPSESSFDIALSIVKFLNFANQAH